VGSSFTFYRPRGIQGTYTVEVSLALLPTEVVVVSANQSSPNHHSGNHQHPQQMLIEAGERREVAGGSRIGIYGINRVVAGDAITIDIQGGVHDLLQRTVFTATMQGFAVRRVTLHTIADAWLADSSIIALIDRDAQAESGREEEASSAIELRVLDVQHGFQIRRLVGTENRAENTPLPLLERILAELSSHHPMARLVSPKKGR
jgi:hypothetical protein